MTYDCLQQQILLLVTHCMPSIILTSIPFISHSTSHHITSYHIISYTQVLWVISFGMFLHRVSKLKKRSPEVLKGYDLYRGLIACAIDNDSPYYTITSFSAISFLFLGGVQTDYQTTLLVMIVYYAIVSFGESLRVLMAYWSYGSLGEVFLFTQMDAGLRDKQKEDLAEKDQKFETMEVQPNNIYEDMGREKTIVIMIFLTQMILVSFVCIDIFRAETVRCMDGTPNCPVGTYNEMVLGSVRKVFVVWWLVGTNE